MNKITNTSSQHISASMLVSFLPPGHFLEGVTPSLWWWGQHTVVFYEVEGPGWLLSVRKGRVNGRGTPYTC